MRQNFIIALLSVCCTLLAVNVYVTLRGPQLPVAFGQGSGSDEVLIAGANIQNEAFCFLYNKSRTRLISYKNRGSGGLELMGIRNCSSDWNPKINEYPRSNKKTAVKNMKDLAKKSKEK